MTEQKMFAGMAEHSLDLQRASAGNETQNAIQVKLIKRQAG
jgi:hypothetical protein